MFLALQYLLAGLVLMIILSGCGIFVNSTNRVKAIQFSPGDLYSSEFYKNATLEDVKKAIGDESLAQKSFIKKRYEPNTEGGYLGRLPSVITLFSPLSSVETDEPIYPLQVAVLNTPHLEIIEFMIDAGADISHVLQTFYAIHGANAEVSKLLIKNGSLDMQCESFAFFSSSGNKDMVDYCLKLGIHTSCLATHWEHLPLKNALVGNQTDIVATLFSHGAKLPEDTHASFELLDITLKTNNSDNFWLLLDKGLGYSAFGTNEKNTLMATAAQYVHDKSVFTYLLKTVHVDEKNAIDGFIKATRANNIIAFDALLQWNNGLPSEKNTILTLLKNSLQNNDSAIFWKLIESGADSYLSNENDLMREASYKFKNDTKVINYLAQKVPPNDLALYYALEIGNAQAVKSILERGSFPSYKVVLSKKNMELEAIKYLLKEKNISFEIK